ncbi:hypothetical protein RHAB21_00726 [Pseudorhizobium halotolerans]|uniref:Uncharacterized protein n=1 Tax=Pseudorhizobium halotolerans TaxID=1233081 RepID=A0ABM8PYY6_9HYPH|nr:hypothetical protein [Pseudorhizobium halotolerans]CAD7055481.1 hypothetical protein RHAB21_00726 [Pseudorhizobium halotolerans]
MRNQPAAITAVQSAATDAGLITRLAVWVVAKNRATGLPEPIGVWDGDEDIALSVIDGETNQVVTRPYYGGGNLLTVSEIPRTSDFTVQTVSIDLSQLATVAQLVTRTHDVHRAHVEIHEILLHPETGQPVAADLPLFLGIVDGMPIKTPRIGGEGRATLKCVSEVMSMLTRTNPEKASYEAQKLRGGDEWNLYAGVIETWDLPWGQKAS